MLLAVYGTLRRGDYNHGRYLEGFEPLSTERVEGFEMYTLRQYPYIARGADHITVEVYSVPEDVLTPIERMERDAGYGMTSVKTSHGMASIFYMTEKEHAQFQSRTTNRPPKIISGDWFEWLKKYNPSRVGGAE